MPGIQFCCLVTTLCDPMGYSPPGSSVHGISQARTGVGCHSLLQGIFPTQRSNPCLLHLLHQQADSFTTSPPGKPLHSYLSPFLGLDHSSPLSPSHSFRVRERGLLDVLRKMAARSSILAWEIPWREEHGRLYSMGSQSVRHN